MHSWKSWWRAPGMTFKCLKLCGFGTRFARSKSLTQNKNHIAKIETSAKLNSLRKWAVKFHVYLSSHAIIDFYLNPFGNVTQSPWPLGWSLSISWVCGLILRSCFKIKIKHSAGVHLGWGMSVHQTKSASICQGISLIQPLAHMRLDGRREECIYEYKKTSWTKSYNLSMENLSMIVFQIMFWASSTLFSFTWSSALLRWVFHAPWTNKLAGSTNDDGQGRHKELLPWIGG